MNQLSKILGCSPWPSDVVGCGKGDEAPAYANVSGTVTYNGKPLEKGQITFSTDGRPPSIDGHR